MHPRLLWGELIAASAAVLPVPAGSVTCSLDMDVQDVPGFGSGSLYLAIDLGGVSAAHLERLRRTYEPHRLIELAAIAVTGLALSQAGRHEIWDVAARGSGADYLVDAGPALLEIAGRSRAVDLVAAWEQKRQRSAGRHPGGLFICIVEFETPAGRLGFLE